MSILPHTRSVLRSVPLPWGRVVVSLLFGLMSQWATVALMATSAFLISRAALHRPIMELGVAVVGVRFFSLCRVGSRYLERLSSHDLALRYLGKLRSRYFAVLEPQVPQALDHRHSGEVLHQFVNDVDELQNVFLRGFGPIVVALLVSIAAVLFTWWMVPAAVGLVVVGLAIASVLVPVGCDRLMSQAESNLVAVRTRYAETSADLLQNAEVARMLNATEWLRRRVKALSNEVCDAERAMALRQGLAQGMLLCTLVALAAGVFVIGASELEQGLRPEYFAALGFAVLALFEALAPVPRALSELREIESAAIRLVFSERDETKIATVALPEPHLVLGQELLRVNNATLQYENSANAAFSGVTFALQAGARLAVVGPSGSGKTSLGEAIVGFRPLSDGQITYLGRDITRVDGDELRRQVGLVAHDAYVFAETLRVNLAIGKTTATDEELVEVLGRVGLGEWYFRQPNGLDTRLESGGGNLSGGERRRLTLARMLLAQPRILLIDEPTAHLDEALAADLMRDLLSFPLAEGTALVVFTHRLTELEQFDQVLMLKPK